MPAGRPTDYSEELVAIICSRIAEGESLNKICKEDSMPSAQSIYLWLFKHKEFSDKYAKAREDQAETLADEIIEIADDSRNDKYIDAEGNERVNTEVVARSRLRVDARKWIASKLKPKKFGEKVSQEISGPDGGNIPVKIAVEFVKPDEK